MVSEMNRQTRRIVLLVINLICKEFSKFMENLIVE